MPRRWAAWANTRPASKGVRLSWLNPWKRVKWKKLGWKQTDYKNLECLSNSKRLYLWLAAVPSRRIDCWCLVANVDMPLPQGAREKWPPGLRYAFPPPPMVQLTLGQLKLMGGELILITPYWPDQCWFPEVIQMAVLPPRRFKPHKWLLTNATTGEAIPKVMESIKLTAWKLSTGFVGERGYLMKPRDGSSLIGARVPRQVTDQHGITGVLSAIKKGYQSFKFVWRT